MSSVTALSIKKKQNKKNLEQNRNKNKQIDERDIILMQWDGKAHNHFMAIVLIQLCI